MLKFEKQNQKQLKTMLNSSFSLADAFSLTPSLRIFKQEKFSSQIGKLASIGMVCIFAIQFILALQDVTNYASVSVVSKQISALNSEPMYFTPNNFTLALVFATPSQINIANIFTLLNITIQNCQTLRQYSPSGELNVLRKCHNYPVTECSMNYHFPTEVQQQAFIMKNMSTTYCIASEAWSNRSIVLQGTALEQNYQYINIIASICQNNSISQKCAPQAEIEQKLGLIYYGFYFNDLLTQMDSVKQPLKELIVLTGAPVSRFSTKILIQNNQIQQSQTDTGYIMQNWIEQMGVSLYNLLPSSDPYNGQYILQHVIQQYNIIMNYRRSYAKVQTILGQLGGLWQIMYYGVLLIVYPIVSINMNMALANKLFSFSQNENQESQMVDRVNKNRTIKPSIFRNPQMKKFDLNDQDELARFIKTKKSSLNMDIKVILLQLFGCRKLEKQQLDYAKQKIVNKLDVSYILTKLIEIDKLKLILLTKDQRQLFNSLPKPTIPKALFNSDKRIAIEDNAKYEIILQEEKSDLMKLQEAFAAYKNITSYSQGYLNSIDEKLIHQLDTDIYDLFKQIEYEGQNLPSSSPFRRSIICSIDSSQIYSKQSLDRLKEQVISESQIDIEEQAQFPK